jgi:hypothetical protein
MEHVVYYTQSESVIGAGAAFEATTRPAGRFVAVVRARGGSWLEMSDVDGKGRAGKRRRWEWPERGLRTTSSRVAFTRPLAQFQL